MRAQMIFARAHKGTDERAQGTDWARIEKSFCALTNPYFYYSFLLKGTEAQINNRSQDIYKKAIYRAEKGKTGSLNRIRRIWNDLCPLPSLAFRGAVA